MGPAIHYLTALPTTSTDRMEATLLSSIRECLRSGGHGHSQAELTEISRAHVGIGVCRESGYVRSRPSAAGNEHLEVSREGLYSSSAVQLIDVACSPPYASPGSRATFQTSTSSDTYLEETRGFPRQLLDEEVH